MYCAPVLQLGTAGATSHTFFFFLDLYLRAVRNVYKSMCFLSIFLIANTIDPQGARGILPPQLAFMFIPFIEGTFLMCTFKLPHDAKLIILLLANYGILYLRNTLISHFFSNFCPLSLSLVYFCRSCMVSRYGSKVLGHSQYSFVRCWIFLHLEKKNVDHEHTRLCNFARVYFDGAGGPTPHADLV